MNKNEFIETVKNNVIRYMPENYRNYKVMIHEVKKDGDRTLCGLSLAKEGSSLSPVIYLDNYFEMYQDGMPIERIMPMIAKDYDRITLEAGRMELPDLSYENIKDSLRVRILYNRTNRELLRELVSRDIGCGYSAAVYIDLSDNIVEGSVINVRRSMADAMRYDIDRLFEDAIKGSVTHCPARLSYIFDVLFAGMSDAPRDLLSENLIYNRENGVLVLNTTGRFEGAAALYYPGIQERIAEFVGGDYYVIPSSVHEVLIYPVDAGMTSKDLANMVKTVNATEVAPEDQLGNRVLYYDADAKNMFVACDLDRERSREEAR